MESDRLKRQKAEIESLSEELKNLVESVTKTANPAIQSNIENLETEQRKLHYQANILRRAIASETIEASENDVLSDWDSVETSVYQTPVHPVLPKEGKRNILITSALPYVNNVPHLGNIIGCVLSGDVFARYGRIRGYNVIYICGTDEYGTATETKAYEENLELYKSDVRAACQAVCDKYHKKHKDVYDWFQISTDHFGRTSTNEQTEVVHEIFHGLDKHGCWIEKDVEQLFSPKLDKFLADRFVEGTCPKCSYDDARGDQCDKCGQLINAIELINPRCKFTGCTPEKRTSRHLFLDLPKLEAEIKTHLEAVIPNWSHNAKSIVETWLKKGLEPRCMTRDLKWGIKVPKEGFDHKVFYVWFDAPIGYPSITACYTKEWRKWWFNSQTPVEYFQFMGKDNVPFHSVMWHAYLIGSKMNWKLVDNIQGTEYLNYENGKFSKSRGVGVFGNQAKETDIPSDVWRFYLIYVRPEMQDTEFQWVDFQTKNNSELLNNLGNFVNRALTFVGKFYDRKVPVAQMNGTMRAWCAEVEELLQEYFVKMENNDQRDALRIILSISKLGNKLIQVWQPWVKVKSKNESERNEAAACVMLSANLCVLICSLLEPFMPFTSIEIARQLSLSRREVPGHFGRYLPEGHQIYGATPLFKKITDEEIKEYREKFAGKS